MQVKNYEPSILVLLAAYNCYVELIDTDGIVSKVDASEVIFKPDVGYLVKAGTVINFSTDAGKIIIREGLLQVRGWTLHVEDSPFIRKRLLAYLEGVVTNTALETFAGSKLVGGVVVNADGSSISDESLAAVSSLGVRIAATSNVKAAVTYVMSHYFS